MSIGALDLLRPWALVLLAAVFPVLWWVWHRSIAPLRGWRRVWACVVRGIVCGLLVLSLADPRWNGETHNQEVIFAVDRSASIGDAGVEAMAEFVGEADLGNAETGWLGFGGRARVFAERKEFEEAAAETVDPEATRIDHALALAAASFRSGRVPTVVLFSDGVATGGAVPMESLIDQGVRIHVVPVARPETPEVLVREVRAPSAVREGEPVAIETTIQSTEAGPAEVDLFRNGVRIVTRSVTLSAGANPIRFDDRAGTDKLLHYQVGIRAAADTIAENNLAGTAVIASGPSRVLLLSDRPDSARYLEWALRQEGIELSVRPAEGAPTQMSDLQAYDTVILDNVAASDLDRSQMDLLHAYVADFGGGLLMLGGDQAYGLGGYFRTPIEEVLPVQCDFEKDEETPSLGLALVIDRSGSMSGQPLELVKAAANASAALLGPRDEIAVIAFDSEAHLIVPIQSAANTAAITASIASITAGGGTSIAPGMEEAFRQLSGSGTKLKHVIVMTDGYSSPGPFHELSTAMVQSQMTVSTVAAGQADTALLAQIAAWGNGRFYETDDFANIPQIFTKETMTASKSAIQEFPFLAQPLRAVDFLEGVPWSEAPFLLGYVKTKAKPTSETWLVTERGDPLLTTWRYGLGTSAAFTSDARNRWAVEWLRWPGFGKFWSQLLRRLGRPAAMGRAEIELESDDVETRVRVDALDPDGRFPQDLAGTIRVSTPGGTVVSVPLEKYSPGRWEGRIANSGAGIYSGQVVLERGDELFDSRFFTVTRGFPKEFLLDAAEPGMLADLAEQTGGEVNPDPREVFLQNDRTARVEWELWPWLALLALISFVFDVIIRRWPDSNITSSS